MEEEGIAFEANGLFYNPHMRLSRTLSSLALSTLPPMDILDGFCASGIRGIRYAKENGAKSLAFVDWSRKAIAISLSNAKANGIDAQGFVSDFNRHVLSSSYSFYELDPFGSPSQHIYPALYSCSYLKASYLSITATDLAVLCGKEREALARNYLAFNTTNDYCHESAARIVIGFAVRLAGIMGLSFTPLLTFYYRHQIKVIGKVEKGKLKAYESEAKVGMLGPIGPLWLGDLHDRETLQKMAEENNRRSYTDKERVAKMLSLMEGELGTLPFFYSLHSLSSSAKLAAIPKMASLLEAIKAQGYYAVQTHFSPLGIRTDMPEKEVIALMKNLSPA
ncbi:MAG: hypothetical protein QW035_02320 [Candidatus Anstonellales archaeon]